jgi:hypothetical protein
MNHYRGISGYNGGYDIFVITAVSEDDALEKLLTYLRANDPVASQGAYVEQLSMHFGIAYVART